MANANAATRALLRGNPSPRLGRAVHVANSVIGPMSSIYQELALRTKDFEYFREEFLGATAAEAIGSTKVLQYAEANAGATDPAKLTPTTLHTSSVQLASTANAGYFQNLVGQKNIDADHNPFIEVRFSIDTVTKSAVFMGFVDTVPASAAVIVSDIDTPAFGGGISDAAVMGFDAGQTLTTLALVTVGTSTAAGKTNGAPTGAPWGVPTAGLGNYVRYRIELRGDLAGGVSTAYAYVNDLLVASRAGPDGGKLLTPVFWAGPAVDGTGDTVDIDYIEFGQQKALTPF